MNPQPYSIDLDAQLWTGQGYVVSDVIGVSHDSVIERRTMQPRFSASSEALAQAYDAAQAPVSALRPPVSPPQSGSDAGTRVRYAPSVSAAHVVAS